MPATFGNVPWSEDGRTEKGRVSDVAFMGAPFDTGVGNRPGARFAPEAIRNGTDTIDGYRPQYDEYTGEWFDAVDCGDTATYVYQHVLNLKAAYLKASKILKNTNMLATIGGDHSVMMQTFRAVQEKHDEDVVLIHFDAHPDFWAPDPSGADGEFNHGTPIYHLRKNGLLTTVLHVGLRTYGADRDMYAEAKEQGSTWWTTHDVWFKGVKDVTDELLGHVDDDRPVYISVDIDVLDPGYAPACSTPEPGGMSPRELLWMLRAISEKRRVAGMDVVEVAPPYDPAGMTALVANRCYLEVLSGLAVSRSKTVDMAALERYEDEEPYDDDHLADDDDDATRVRAVELP